MKQPSRSSISFAPEWSDRTRIASGVARTNTSKWTKPGSAAARAAKAEACTTKFWSPAPSRCAIASLEPRGTSLDRRRIVRRGRRRLEAFGQRRMVRLAAHRDYRFDSRLFASLDIARAEIAGVRQQSFGLAQGLGQSADLAQHRFDLVLVVGRLDGTVTLPCEERERSTPYGFSSRRDGLAPRGHRRGA